MILQRLALALVFLLLTAGCGGGVGADAPNNASADDFCAAREWYYAEGIKRLIDGEWPPPEDDLAELAHDWAREMARVGTPENVTPDARAGFEKFVDRFVDIDGGDMPSFDGDEHLMDPKDDEESVLLDYVTNTCGLPTPPT